MEARDAGLSRRPVYLPGVESRGSDDDRNSRGKALLDVCRDRIGKREVDCSVNPLQTAFAPIDDVVPGPPERGSEHVPDLAADPVHGDPHGARPPA